MSITGCWRSGLLYAPNTSCTFSSRSSRATPDRATPSRSVARGCAARCAWVRHDELLSRRMPPHADYPTRRSSPLSRPGKPRRWHTWQPTISVLRRTRLGPSAPLRRPVRRRRHASGNERGSEKDSPRRFGNWSSTTSEVEARSAGMYSTTEIGPFGRGGQTSRALPARSLTAGEPGPLGLVLGQRDRLTVGLTCFVVPAEPAEQVGAGGVERVVRAEVQVVDDGEGYLRSVELGNGDRAVQRDDR